MKRGKDVSDSLHGCLANVSTIDVKSWENVEFSYPRNLFASSPDIAQSIARAVVVLEDLVVI
jgi:hypothetical protein